MHVALNLLFLHPRAGGVGTAAREVVPRMLAADPRLRITVFAGAEADAIREADDWAGNVSWIRAPVTVTHGPPLNFVRTLGMQWLVQPWSARRRGCDVLHGLANMGALVAPGVATVTTIHDLIWMPYAGSMRPRDRFGTRWTTVPAARAADLVLADSHAARDVMVERLNLDPERIAVVPLGVAQTPPAPRVPDPVLRERFGLREGPLLLCVSQKREHKNLDLLVQALARLDRPEVTLLIAGAPTGYETVLRCRADELSVANQLVLPDWVDADDLDGLYRFATAVVLPSLEEGFGLPVLEAMVRGTPVACSNVSALAEVAGDAALTFDPRSPAAIAAALSCVLDDRALRARLAAAGRERARSYTWDRTARATLGAYRRAVERRRLWSWDR